MARWCPSCRLAFDTGRATCATCLTELVEDAAATAHCRYCDRDWPAYMQSCPACLAELGASPERVAQAQAEALASGRRPSRPAGRAAFDLGPGCTLRRLAARGKLVYTGADDFVEATVRSPWNRAAPPLSCHDLDGALLFRMGVYQPTHRGLVAYDATGAPLATFIGGPLHDRFVDVRDETSAPVARLLVHPSSPGDWALIETGGDRLASVSSADAEHQGWVDDQWTLHPLAADLPLAPLAAVTIALAAKILLGRPTPVRAARLTEMPDGSDMTPDGLADWGLGWN